MEIPQILIHLLPKFWLHDALNNLTNSLEKVIFMCDMMMYFYWMSLVSTCLVIYWHIYLVSVFRLPCPTFFFPFLFYWFLHLNIEWCGCRAGRSVYGFCISKHMGPDPCIWLFSMYWARMVHGQHGLSKCIRSRIIIWWPGIRTRVSLHGE